MNEDFLVLSNSFPLQNSFTCNVAYITFRSEIDSNISGQTMKNVGF